MKKILLALLLVFGVLALPAPASAWSAISGCHFGEGSSDGNGFTTTGASCNSTGASIVVVLINTYAPAGVVDSITNSTGGTKVCGAPFTDSMTIVTGQLCIFEAVTGASGNTITIACTLCYPSVVVKAFSGSTGCALLDQTATTNSNLSTSIGANSITIVVDDILVIQALGTTDPTGPITADDVFAGNETTIQGSAGVYLGGAMSYAVRNNGDTSPTDWSLGALAYNVTSAKSFFDTGTSCGGGATPSHNILLLGVQ